MLATVINCKTLGIRKDPEDTEYADDIIGEVKAGTKLEVDPTDRVYSWTGKEFYKVWTPYGAEGYAIIDCLELGGKR